MAPHDLVGGWFIAPRRRERRVVDHHLDVLRDPLGYGLTVEGIERLGQTNRVAILTAVMKRGWIRIRVPSTREATLHIEVWRLDRARAMRIAGWLRRRGPWPDHHPVVLGMVDQGTRHEVTLEDLRTHLRTL